MQKISPFGLAKTAKAACRVGTPYGMISVFGVFLTPKSAILEQSPIVPTSENFVRNDQCVVPSLQIFAAPMNKFGKNRRHFFPSRKSHRGTISDCSYPKKYGTTYVSCLSLNYSPVSFVVET